SLEQLPVAAHRHELGQHAAAHRRAADLCLGRPGHRLVDHHRGDPDDLGAAARRLPPLPEAIRAELHARGDPLMRVLTWNIQWGKGCDGVVDLTRIVATARAMGDPDVYCFQEVAENYPALDGGRGENQPATLQRLLPGYAMVWRPAIDRPASGRRFGNIVFSRLPVLDVASHLLPRPVEPGVRSMQRHAVEVTVE